MFSTFTTSFRGVTGFLFVIAVPLIGQCLATASVAMVMDFATVTGIAIGVIKMVHATSGSV